ncbi:MAG: chloride channel protein [Planctomycetota bacterium]|jgi:CIC family chloride channel protein
MSTAPKIVSRWQSPATRWGRRLGLAVIVGVAAGIAAVLLDRAIHIGWERLTGRVIQFDTVDFVHFDWRILLLPAIGGLVAGLLVYLGAPRSTGHGVDVLTRAFHRHLGHLPLRGPAVKGGGAAIVISAGGSAGPEGPIAALGAALGSTIARFFPLTAQERRILLIAGCAAGIGAIFRCPLGGALFATSILYSDPEFEPDAIVPSFVASVIGYTTFRLLLGDWELMIEGIEVSAFQNPSHLPWYAILGLLCGLTSILFFFCLRTVERGIVPRSRLPRWFLPALGGLGTGAIACLLPQVMDNRYEFIKSAIEGGLFDAAGPIQSPAAWAALFGLVAIAKCVATALTVGSGAPGGVLGPSVFIGGAVGACLGMTGHALFPDTFPPELRGALIAVGMAGVLAATMRIPLAAIVMTMEMTGSFGLIAPLMLACVVSYLVGRRWGLNDEQVRTAADSPTHAADPIVHLLESWRVGQVMQKAWPMTVPPSARLDEIIAKLEPGTRPLVAVAENDDLKGVISGTDLGVVMGAGQAERLLIASDIMTTKLATLDEQEDVYSALTTFTRVEHDVLPVVSHGRGGKWVGMLTRRRVVDRLHEELDRSHEAAFQEHLSLRAIREDLRLDQLVMRVPGQHSEIQRLFVPIDAIGKSLRECDFRKKYNIQVIALEESDGSYVCPPDPDRPLTTKERLLAVIWTARGSKGE